jgi:Retinoic acid induced 16-like protein
MTEELIASTAYLDLFLRSITEPGLMQTFLRFLITDHYDGERVIDKLVSRLGTKSQVSSRFIFLFVQMG